MRESSLSVCSAFLARFLALALALISASCSALAAFFALVLAGTHWGWHRAPDPAAPLGGDEGGGDPGRLSSSPHFSEGRAMRHVHRLSKVIGQRQVGTRGLVLAEEYLRAECDRVAALCADLGTCEAEVAEETVSGAFQVS